MGSARVFRPEVYGAVGDGVNLDTHAMQLTLDMAAQDGGVVACRSNAKYLCGPLTVDSYYNAPIAIEGENAQLLAAPQLLGYQALLANGSRSSYLNGALTIRGLRISGNGVGLGTTMRRTSALVLFRRMMDLTLEDVEVYNTGYIGMSVNGCKDVTIVRPGFYDCGWDRVSANGGPALWVASDGGGSVYAPERIDISHGNFALNRWIGIHFSAKDSRVVHSDFRNNGEAHIFGSDYEHAPINNVGISNNTMDGVHQVNISAVGIEMGGRGLRVHNNQITKCERQGVSLTKAQSSICSNNRIGNVGDTDKIGSCIQIVANGTDALGNRSKELIISDNILFDDQEVSDTDDGILVFGNGDPCQDSSVHGNVFGRGIVASGGDAFRKLGQWHVENNCITHDNIGIVNDPT